MENKCEALPGVAYPGVRDNRSTINTKTGYDDDDYITQIFLYSVVFQLYEEVSLAYYDTACILIYYIHMGLLQNTYTDVLFCGMIL